MRQRFLLWVITGCMVCALSCTKKQSPHEHLYTAFKTCSALRGESVPLDTALFRYPYRLAVKDGILLVMDLHNADDFYHAFTYPGGKHLASFGHRGNGPEEVVSPENIRFHSLDSIWTLDGRKMEVVRWGLTPGTYIPQRLECIPLNRIFIRTLDFLLTDTCLLVPDYTGKYRYHRADYTGNPVSAHGRIPVASKDQGTPALAQAWRSFMACDRDQHTVVMATQLGEVIEIYNLADASVQVLTGPNAYPMYRQAGGNAIPNGIMGFWDVQIAGERIYAVFSGQTLEERIKMYAEGIEPEAGGRSIYVFSLEGEPVCKYTLDHAVSGIFVDEEGGFILAVDVNSDNPIVRFSLH